MYFIFNVVNLMHSNQLWWFFCLFVQFVLNSQIVIAVPKKYKSIISDIIVVSMYAY